MSKCEHGTENCPGFGEKHHCVQLPSGERIATDARMASTFPKDAVIKPSKPTHPAEVNELLGLAYQRVNKLIDDAERRKDQVGADAWLVARNAIEAAEKAMREAREKQTWRDR